MARHVIALDQGTTSTRAIIFDDEGDIVSVAQKEHSQIFPRPGWVEHDPLEIWSNARDVLVAAVRQSGIRPAGIAALGVTNQTETTIVWDKRSGQPIYNAIVWQDTRTHESATRLAEHVQPGKIERMTGSPLTGYFAATKIAWLLENVPGARARAKRGELLFGSVESWVTWNLTGGRGGGLHRSDVTNASRTLLMDLHSLEWHPDLLGTFCIPASMLPQIVSSSESIGEVVGIDELTGVPIAALMGDQQAAMLGQAAFDAGSAKNTYGTGSFLLFNTGNDIVRSQNGMLTTVAYRIGSGAPSYALEGSIAVTGSLVQWLRDNLGIIRSSSEIEALASTVSDNGGVYFVPAFSGLYAPYWRPDARGTIVGLTHASNKGHIARAALEASAYQTRAVLEAVNSDWGPGLTELRVDGGMSRNDALMQFQSDILGVPVIRPMITETTALGIAYAAGMAVGVWDGVEAVRSRWREDRRWEPTGSAEERQTLYDEWNRAVDRSLNWVTSMP